MSYEILTKGLIMVAAVYMVTSVLVFEYHNQSRQALQEINSMSSNLNDAEKPGGAFQNFNQDFNASKTSLGGQLDVFGKKIEGKSFSSRMMLSWKALYDSTYSFNVFLENRKPTQAGLSTEGLYLESCPDSYSYEDLCNNLRSPKVLNQWAGWMTYAQETGTINGLTQNQTAWNKMRDYLERAQYYDERLTDFQMRPLQIVYYTDTGLYVVGRGEERMRIGDDTFMLEGQDPLRYADITLDNGSHIVTRGNHRILLEVGPDIPDYAINKERMFAVDNDTGPYTAVELNGDRGTNSKQLNTENNTLIRIPADQYQETQKYGPFRATFISDRYNQTVTLGQPNPGMNDQKVYYFGMGPEEYRRARQLLNMTDLQREMPVI